MVDLTQSQVATGPLSAPVLDTGGVFLAQYRIERDLVANVSNESHQRCIREMLRTLWVVRAYATDLKQSHIQSSLASTLAMCIPNADDIPEIRSVAQAIFTDHFLRENAKPMWRRMVRSITPEWRVRVKDALRGYGWKI